VSLHRVDVSLHFDEDGDLYSVVKTLRRAAALAKRSDLNRRRFHAYQDLADDIEDAWLRQRRKSGS
jgi:hypothetical protein